MLWRRTVNPSCPQSRSRFWRLMAKSPRPPAAKLMIASDLTTKANTTTTASRCSDEDGNSLLPDKWDTMKSAKAVVFENRYAAGLDPPQLPSRTITGLKRWSIANRELPGELLPLVEGGTRFANWAGSDPAGKSYSCIRLRQHM